MKTNTQLTAVLRCCASCDWIFKNPDPGSAPACPKCGFATYGAKFVHGDAAYRYAKTQRPWFERRMGYYASQLHGEIEESMQDRPASATLPYYDYHCPRNAEHRGLLAKTAFPTEFYCKECDAVIERKKVEGI